MKGYTAGKPPNGTKRIITKFALFPVRLEDGNWRWLETVTVEQEFDCNYGNYDSWPSDWWKNLRFIDEENNG